MFTIQNGKIVDCRASWDEIFMQHAELAAKRSTCIRMQTGAVLVRDRRIVSEGYNGTVPGSQHCTEYWFEQFKQNSVGTYNVELQKDEFAKYLERPEFSADHHAWSTLNEIHGEENCILFAGKHGIPTSGPTTVLYTVYSPCIYCAKSIVTAGITRVVFRAVYPRDVTMEGIKFLEKHGVQVDQLPPPPSIQ